MSFLSLRVGESSCGSNGRAFIPCVRGSQSSPAALDEQVLLGRSHRHQLLLQTPTNPTKSEAKQLRPDNSQDSLTLIRLSELSSIPTACLFDPTPTTLLKESFPFIRTFTLDIITGGYGWMGLADHYRPIFKLPFLFKILESSCQPIMCLPPKQSLF